MDTLLEQLLSGLPAGIGLIVVILYSTWQVRKSEQNAIVRASESNTEQEKLVTKFAHDFSVDKDKLQTELTEVKVLLAHKEGALGILEKQIARAEVDRKEDQKVLMKLMSDFELIKTEREKDKQQIEILINERDSARNERDNARAERDTEKAKVTSLELQVTRQAQSITKLNQTIEQLQTTTKTQESTILALNARITELENKAA